MKSGRLSLGVSASRTSLRTPMPGRPSAILDHDHAGAGMTIVDVKGDLHTYLRGARETLVWKLDGLGEYDIRRPLTPTGTNLLGLVKHNAAMEVLYFGEVFGRAHDTWSGDAEP